MNKIPFLKVSGSHFACGEQVGLALKNEIYKYRDICRNDPPDNLTWQECIQQADRFIQPTQASFPQLIDELKGVASGSGLGFDELFALTIDELWADDYSSKGCTDIVLLPPASPHTLVLHNNDLPAIFYGTDAQIEWGFDDGSQMFTVGSVFMPCVGINNSKIVLTGDTVTSTDTRVGIPRNIIARAILLAKTFDEAVKIANHSDRASSYNNIITTLNQSISVEGSATNYELIFPKNGILTHSNHYCSPKMLSYEGSPNYESSIQRLESVDNLASQIKQPVDLKTAESFLANHGPKNIGDNNTVCRHGDLSPTHFGFAVDLDTGVVELSHGHPCQNPFEKVWQIKI